VLPPVVISTYYSLIRTSRLHQRKRLLSYEDTIVLSVIALLFFTDAKLDNLFSVFRMYMLCVCMFV